MFATSAPTRKAKDQRITPEIEGQKYIPKHPSCSFLSVLILGWIGVVLVLGLGLRLIFFIGDLPHQPIKQPALDYFATVKNNYPGATFGELKTANLERLTVSDADRANGITEKATINLTFIYLDSSTAEWKDAQWKLWLEKKTDWKVVNAQKER